jgi:hypothetical protein
VRGRRVHRALSAGDAEQDRVRFETARLLFAEPSYFHEVAVAFVFVNLVMAFLGALFVGLARDDDRRGGP